MLIRAVCLFVMLVFPVVTLAADSKSSSTDKAAWNKELAKLRREKPDEYVKFHTTATFIAEIVLAELGYGTGPFDGVQDKKTITALREYEKKRGIPVTGDPLSYETFNQLEKDKNIIDYQPVSLPGLHIFTEMWDDGYVSASGTWIISGEKMGWPEQTSKIDCYKNIGKCIEATAIVSGEGDMRVLSVDIDTYEIERWDQHEIVTKPLQFLCTRYVRRFNRLQKSVTGIRSTISNHEGCKGIEASQKYLVLTDGFKVYWELKQNRMKKMQELVQISLGLLKTLEGSSGQKPQ